MTALLDTVRSILLIVNIGLHALVVIGFAMFVYGLVILFRGGKR